MLIGENERGKMKESESSADTDHAPKNTHLTSMLSHAETTPLGAPKMIHPSEVSLRNVIRAICCLHYCTPERFGIWSSKVYNIYNSMFGFTTPPCVSACCYVGDNIHRRTLRALSL